ncbi:MAG TPA: sulfatase-like hydrolase/transferase [Gemmatimonadales bacterium]|nr:sulfatase-like hydrolase/transferase [Gemmatimonadales bacterium]
MRNLRFIYPFLFIMLPILNTLNRNPGGATLTDVGGLIAIMLLACLALYAIVALATGGRWADPLVPLVVLAAVLWFYGYEAVRSVHRFARGTPAPIVVTGLVVALAAVATVAALRWLARRTAYLDRVSTFFALTGVLLVGWSGFRIVADQLKARSKVRASALARELTRPLPVHGSNPAARAQPQRDIYLLILDEYASSRVLSERFGFDNREFEDSLRKLGFTVPPLVRSNYVHTLLSIPSLLNFSHLDRLQGELGPRETDPALPNYLVENNRTTAFLKAQGYKFLFFPSQWWVSTQHNRNADWEFQPWSGLQLGRELTRSDMRRVFVGSTPLSLLRRDFGHDADHVKRTLDALARSGGPGGPKFALAHILNPHYPYVFDAECRTVPKRPVGAWDQRRRDAYIEQVKCLNRLLLKTVTALRERSSPAPIILLVGDHGTASTRYSSAKSADAVAPVQARERFGTFGAFHLPEGGGRLFADSVTLVNVIPKVLNYYFDAGIPLAPDSLYMSLEQTPYLFAPVNPASLAERL